MNAEVTRTVDHNPLDAAAHPSVITVFPACCQSTTQINPSMLWYRAWLSRRASQLSLDLSTAFPTLAEANKMIEGSSLLRVYLGVARMMKEGKALRVDDIVAQLQLSHIFRVVPVEQTCFQRVLVFTVLGWQTMLWEPIWDAANPTQMTVAQLMDGYESRTFMAYTQDHRCARLPMHEFLLGFGYLLPTKSTDRQSSESFATVHAKQFNMSLLATIGGIKIRWIDTLGAHLEFDNRTKTLFLFRFPSFCAANLEKDLSGEKWVPGVIHGCTAPAGDPTNWATAEDVTSFLYEVLLSYRLLFGLSAKGRQFYHSICPFSDLPPDQHDPLLGELCGSRTLTTVSMDHHEDVFSLVSDFPILHDRFEALQTHLACQKARGLIQLWRDKRSTEAWYTFWAVVLIGGVGLFLSFVQTVLQIMQVLYSIP
ncbi:hypothetical protein F9C07_1185037 [Aspergillus flavus]|uniref:Uncharacterized protein n=1 Tax=Aspergillus flavus (strain ATCC 200026 / FGSC A1120 / IAM 13836 / NRRL 3357 / JCM 12722 / SRRC 167) TaxID=332952 RepID=A0A7U2MD91_ASPFN|nr:hypothetical protein F9C07_1185037 [Aspergillus flavus]UDD55036.1 hypothetical protein AFCA_002680 [Aspergillus flavus]